MANQINHQAGHIQMQEVASQWQNGHPTQNLIFCSALYVCM
jgi:hypothetical protein